MSLDYWSDDVAATSLERGGSSYSRGILDRSFLGCLGIATCAVAVITGTGILVKKAFQSENPTPAAVQAENQETASEEKTECSCECEGCVKARSVCKSVQITPEQQKRLFMQRQRS